MSSQALCSSKITTGAHSLVGRGFLPWAEFSCFVGLDAVVRFLAWGPRAALLCWGTHMWITAGRAGSDRMAAPGWTAVAEFLAKLSGGGRDAVVVVVVGSWSWLWGHGHGRGCGVR